MAMGVSTTTIKRWHSKGLVKGISLGSRKSKSGRLYILKSGLSRAMLEYNCMVCGKVVMSRTYRDPVKRRFCSKKCCDKWWNIYRPVGSDRTRGIKATASKRRAKGSR